MLKILRIRQCFSRYPFVFHSLYTLHFSGFSWASSWEVCLDQGKFYWKHSMVRMNGSALDGLALPCTRAKLLFPVFPALPVHTWWEDSLESQQGVSLKSHGIAVSKGNALFGTETGLLHLRVSGKTCLTVVILKSCHSVLCQVNIHACWR